MRDFDGYMSDLHVRPRRDPLSPTELEVLRYLSHGLSIGDVARVRGVTTDTIKTTLIHARAKLAAKTKEHAVAIALRHGLID